MRTLKNLLKSKKLAGHPERRVGYAPVPEGIEHILTEAQGAWLRNSADGSWSLAFVRSEGLLEPQIVVVDDDDNSYAILSDDGIVRHDGALRFRTYGLFSGQ